MLNSLLAPEIIRLSAPCHQYLLLQPFPRRFITIVMIGTFWSMCRACPSVPVDKFHSEYRSTYRWHEYTGPKEEIIRRPPQGSLSGPAQEPAWPRRKKHPELAYRTHEFFKDSGSQSLQDQTYFFDRARSEERWASSREKNSRRSKSEGPPAGKPTYRLIFNKPINIPNRSSAKNSEYYINDENEAPKTTITLTSRNNIIQSEPLNLNPLPTSEIRETKIQFGQVPGSNLLNLKPSEGYSQNAPKKSISMNAIKNKETINSQDTVPVHGKTAEPKSASAMEVLQPIKTNVNADDSTDGEFKSEYKKNFQPFTSYDYDETKGVFEKRNLNNKSDVESPSWYREVVLLRKKANQYRYRGWGTELIPDHMAQLYNDQLMVWEQVSRRSTLSALSLASTVLSRERSTSKEEKENRKSSPAKSLTRARSAKAAAATHQGKSGEKRSRSQVKAPASKPTREPSPKKGINQVKKLGIKRTSPNRTSRDSASVGTPPTIHKVLNQSSDKPKRRPRPTSLITTVPTGSKTAQSKKKDESDGDVDQFPTIEQEQIVKSPPEPTRVKSPEQIVIRSPEPVNWTVPLDTGKTFTVTQNIREGDLAPRSFSDVRAWTPSAQPPPASISAPTELIELAKTNIQGEILTK